MEQVDILNSIKLLVYISLASTLISVFTAKTRFCGSVRYICGICVLSALITVLNPLLRSVGGLVDIDLSYTEDIGDGNAASDKLVTEQSAVYICEYVKTLIAQKYSLSSEDISVSVTLDAENRENIIIKSITLSFKNTDETLYPEIARYISDTVGCECTVISK